MDTVAILGVGLIGGSFGLALRRAGYAGRILGVFVEQFVKIANAEQQHRPRVLRLHLQVALHRGSGLTIGAHGG